MDSTKESNSVAVMDSERGSMRVATKDCCSVAGRGLVTARNLAETKVATKGHCSVVVKVPTTEYY